MTAIYNEIDPKAAAWLRELVAGGLIAPGTVDERDIRDIAPDELRSFQQVHLFAGIGGWSLALRRAGWEDSRPVWTASCPCQPFSAAGGRSGFADERHLWPAVYHLATQCRPPVLLGEQVASADGLAWIDLVSSDMEAAAYSGGALDLCSAGFGAPNIRQRLYFVWMADALRGGAGYAPGEGLGPQATADGGNGHLPRERLRPGIEGAACGLADTGGAGLPQQQRVGRTPRETGGRGTREAAERGGSPVGRLAHADGGDASAEGLQRGGEHGQRAEDGRAGWMAHAGHTRPPQLGGRRDEPARLAAPGDALRPGPLNGFWRDADWIGCTDGKWRPVAPGSFPLATGIRNRVALLRGAGNAINVEVAAGFIEEVMAVIETERDRLAA